MNDHELNEAIFAEVETDDVRTTDYCHDPAWCVQMLEKHKFHAEWLNLVKSWWLEYGDPDSAAFVEVGDPSLTRAVALAVLQLTREGKSNV